MISRRALLGTGAGVLGLAGAVAVADATHRLDDFARNVGLKPRAHPVPSDVALMVAAAEAQNVVLATVETVAAQHPALSREVTPFATIVQTQVKAVGGSPTVPPGASVSADPAAAVDELAATFLNASQDRAEDANAAVSPDLARVLSSMSAGLAQCAKAIVRIA